MTDERIVRHEWNGNEETVTEVGQIVRCKDCVKKNDDERCPYCNQCGRRNFPPDNWFCADGEKKQ